MDDVSKQTPSFRDVSKLTTSLGDVSKKTPSFRDVSKLTTSLGDVSKKTPSFRDVSKQTTSYLIFVSWKVILFDYVRGPYRYNAKVPKDYIYFYNVSFFCVHF